MKNDQLTVVRGGIIETINVKLTTLGAVKNSIETTRVDPEVR